MKIGKQFFNNLEKQLENDFGKKCWKVNKHKLKGFAPLCPVCQAWLAYETLRDLYEVDYKIKENKNVKNREAI